MVLFLAGWHAIIHAMDHWTDQGIVLSARMHGESGAIVSLLTELHGRAMGYVRGGQSSRLRGVLEAGGLVNAQWASRTADGLGAFVLEQERNLAAPLLGDAVRLAGLISACALCEATLPEGQPHAGLFHGLLALVETMQLEIWGAAYVLWELALLRELGYGVELSKCAGGGDPMELCWVSPRSGHAVSATAGEPYKEKLLPLPGFLSPQKGEVTDEAVLQGLQLTRYFLEHRAFAHHSRGLPDERLRF